VGCQLTGRRFDEMTLLRLVDAYQRDTAWHNAEPMLRDV
jgi:Asp-tRNA(Asn)/Glu-tRNA(Gln) amidotransferase A subunit family amidase